MLNALLRWLFLSFCSLAWPREFSHTGGGGGMQAGMEGFILPLTTSTGQSFSPLSFGSLCPSLAALRWAEGKHLFIRVVSLNKAIGASAGQAVLGRLSWPSHDRCCAFGLLTPH